MIDWTEDITEPPVTKNMPLDDVRRSALDGSSSQFLISDAPCHSQTGTSLPPLGVGICPSQDTSCPPQEKFCPPGHFFALLMRYKLEILKLILNFKILNS